MAVMQSMDLDANIRRYMGDRGPNDRYTSFDYCFNYFQTFREERREAELDRPENAQLSCLQLGFYLASWGMYRGSTDLLKRSSRHLLPVVGVIASTPDDVWYADAHNYSNDVIAAILYTAAQIRGALSGGATDTLVTKILLGAFGCVPAFDQRFRTGSRLNALSRSSLHWIGQFYADNRGDIEKNRVRTIDFDTGKPTERRYTRAKVIDMVFFAEGGGSLAET
jgi:hypothetical protein